MLAKDNRTKILELFFDNPAISGGFQLREISRIIKIAPKSVKIYLTELTKADLIISNKNRQGYPTYTANRDSEYFKVLKKLSMQKRILESGLINYLSMECAPKVIILFGSASIGEDIISSDIDLLLICKHKELELKKYEEFTKRKINILFEHDFNKLSSELKNNLINGIRLYGYLEVF